MNKDDNLVTIATFEHSFDAELAKLLLDNEGIECVLLGEELVGMLTYGVPSINVQLQVAQSDEERARQILAEKHPLEDGENTDE